MNTKSIKKILSLSGKFLAKHAPELLTALGITSMVTSTVLAVKATPAAVEKIKSDSEDAHDGDPDAYTKTEAIKSAWKYYIPTALTTTVGVLCLVSANTVSLKRNTALATAYKLTETAFTEFKAKTNEVVGEEKAQEIRDKLTKDSVEKNPCGLSNVIIDSDKNIRCLEPISGRYFWSTADKIDKAVIKLNNIILTDAFDGGVSLNDFYYELGLDDTISGNELGWGLRTTGIIKWKAGYAGTDDREPYLMIDYTNRPRPNYDK